MRWLRRWFPRRPRVVPVMPDATEPEPDVDNLVPQGSPLSMRCRICLAPRVQHWVGGVLVHVFCATCDSPNANGDVFDLDH